MDGAERSARRATASARPKLKKFLLRYYPPGIILEYELAGELRALYDAELAPVLGAEPPRVHEQQRKAPGRLDEQARRRHAPSPP